MVDNDGRTGTAQSPTVNAIQLSASRIPLRSNSIVQFTNFASPDFVESWCYTCGAGTRQEHVFSVQSSKVNLCRDCGTHMVVPHPVDGENDIPDPFSIRYYAYRGAHVSSIVQQVDSLLQAFPGGGKFLDVGCSLGFSVDYVRKMPGWTAVGVEPSYFAGAAKAWLGVDVIHGTTEGLPVSNKHTFDIIFCTEVLEHVPFPVEFLKDLVTWLSPRGILYLTTPSAESIYECGDNATIEPLVSAGSHYFVPSKVGLMSLLEKAGVPKCEIDNNGLSHVVTSIFRKPVKSKAPLKSVKSGKERAVDKYYKKIVSDRKGDTLNFYQAACFRAFIDSVNVGNYSAAVKLRSHVKKELENVESKIRTLATSKNLNDAFRTIAPNIASLAHSEAMLSLNIDHDHKGAAMAFANAGRLAIASNQLSQAFYSYEYELYQSCLFHEAYALRFVDPFEAQEKKSVNAKLVTAEYWKERINSL